MGHVPIAKQHPQKVRHVCRKLGFARKWLHICTFGYRNLFMVAGHMPRAKFPICRCGMTFHRSYFMVGMCPTTQLVTLQRNRGMALQRQNHTNR